MRRNEELEQAIERGHLVTKRKQTDELYKQWGQYCDKKKMPDVFCRTTKKFATIRLDLFPVGNRVLSPPAVRELIGLAYGEEWLEIHDELNKPRDERTKKYKAAEIDAYFKRRGNGDPGAYFLAERVPIERAEEVTNRLAELARTSAMHPDERKAQYGSQK